MGNSEEGMETREYERSGRRKGLSNGQSKKKKKQGQRVILDRKGKERGGESGRLIACRLVKKERNNRDCGRETSKRKKK